MLPHLTGKYLKHHFSAFVNIKKAKADHMKYLTRKITCVVTRYCAHAREFIRFIRSEYFVVYFGKSSFIARALSTRRRKLATSKVKLEVGVDFMDDMM